VSQTTKGIDNSETVMQAVDNYMMIKPSKAACPNRYMSAVAYPAAVSSTPTMAPTMAVYTVVAVTQVFNAILIFNLILLRFILSCSTLISFCV
jgi:hypothetical protein